MAIGILVDGLGRYEQALNCARRCPSPGPSPLVPRGEGRIRARCDEHRPCGRGPPPPGPLPRQTAPGEGENSSALRQPALASAYRVRSARSARVTSPRSWERSRGRGRRRAQFQTSRRAASLAPRARRGLTPEPAVAAPNPRLASPSPALFAGEGRGEGRRRAQLDIRQGDETRTSPTASFLTRICNRTRSVHRRPLLGRTEQRKPFVHQAITRFAGDPAAARITLEATVCSPPGAQPPQALAHCRRTCISPAA
jgi:hypothetical protein